MTLVHHIPRVAQVMMFPKLIIFLLLMSGLSCRKMFDDDYDDYWHHKGGGGHSRYRPAATLSRKLNSPRSFRTNAAYKACKKWNAASPLYSLTVLEYGCVVKCTWSGGKDGGKRGKNKSPRYSYILLQHGYCIDRKHKCKSGECLPI